MDCYYGGVIKAVIFDCFGVLTADSWHEFRMNLPADQQGPASDANHQYGAGMISRDEFLGAIAELTGQSKDTISNLIDNERSKNLPLLHYIAKLKPKYKIGLLSNVASNWIRDEFLTSAEQALFDVFVFSFEEGITKPDPRIYERAIERLGLMPEECVFIDDIELFAEAAKQIGMKALVYENLKKLKDDLSPILSHA